MSKYLQPEHPSYAVDQAWFLFAVSNPRGPGFCRLLLVEAKNHAAVSFLERVGVDGKVSPTVSLMSVHRQCDMIGIRSDLLDEVEFPVFATDMVERHRVERDPLAVQAYLEATAPEKPELKVVKPLPPPARPTAQSPSPVRSSGQNHKKIVEVLGELGFQEVATSVLNNLGDVETMPLGEALQAAVDACRATVG